ncbi:zinc-binding dehydrogenase [Streptomyces sp. NPDC059720]|uniref:zinc-dependent alcohol dehydrogenase n=1 Tax=Streptomyces sp. NPDC059720 TaxID=3346924 RepID=UPI0036C7D2A8
MPDHSTTAIVFTGKDQVEVRTMPSPEPRPGEFTVRLTRSLVSAGTEGICLGRLFEPGTHWDRWVRYPFHPGYSAVGTVCAIGEGTHRVRVGDRVAVRSPHASVVLVGADEDVHLVPDSVTDEEAVWFHLATIAQVGVRRAEHRLGDTVAVLGLGPVGQLASQYARVCGAAQVFAVDLSARRTELAVGNGAHTGLTGTAEKARSAILEATGQGVDVVYDVTGAAPVFAEALRMTREFGTVVVLGDTGTPTAQTLTSDLIVKGLNIVGAHDMHGAFAAGPRNPWNNQRMGELFFSLLARGDLDTASLNSHVFPATEAKEAYRLVQARPEDLTGLILDWTTL